MEDGELVGCCARSGTPLKRSPARKAAMQIRVLRAVHLGDPLDFRLRPASAARC